MKKFLMLLVLAAVVVAVSGCGSMRTPLSGPRSKNVWYNTFFGVTIEGAVYGDGLVINPAGK